MRLRRIACLAAASAVLSGPAAASHDPLFDVTASSYSTNAYSNVTLSYYWGSHTPSSMTFHLPVGWKFAHKDAATSPLTPVPNDEDTIGAGTIRARWQPFCLASADQNLALKWETTFGPSAPTGTVSMFTLEAVGGLFTTNAYVVWHGDHYDIVIPTFPSPSICSSTTDGSISLTIYGTVPGSSPARRITQNPSTTGSYTWEVEAPDTSGGSHRDTDTVTIT